MPNGLTLEKIDSLYLYQGDILLTKEQTIKLFNQDTRSGIISSHPNYWSNNTVYYTFNSNFTYQENVNAAISEWENKTSLDFIQGVGNGDYIEFFHGSGNYSYLGKTGGKQPISLQLGGSTFGTAIHEIGHAVGLIHEQNRRDRDDYVTVFWNNILDDKISQFQIYPAGEIFDIGAFDFSSVMLYSSSAFSKNGSATMTNKAGYSFGGQRFQLSTGDVKGINTIYGPPYVKLSRSREVIR